MYLYFFMKNRKITHNVKFDITIVFINAYYFFICEIMNMRNTYYFQNVIFPRYNISQPKFVYFEYSMKINLPHAPTPFSPKS